MKYRLSTIFPGIDNIAKAAFNQALLCGNLIGFKYQIAQQGFVVFACGGDTGQVSLRNNQNVNRSRRINIVECIHIVIRINLVRGYFPCDNFAK